jgi:hypothetical protein
MKEQAGLYHEGLPVGWAILRLLFAQSILVRIKSLRARDGAAPA